MRLAREREELRIVSDQIGAHTSARTIARRRARRDDTLARLLCISRQFDFKAIAVFHRVNLAGTAQGAVQAMCLMNHAESHLEGHPVEKNNQLQEPEPVQRLETLFADPLRRHVRAISGEG